jgi:hypothetical protein
MVDTESKPNKSKRNQKPDFSLMNEVNRRLDYLEFKNSAYEIEINKLKEGDFT